MSEPFVKACQYCPHCQEEEAKYYAQLEAEAQAQIEAEAQQAEFEAQAQAEAEEKAREDEARNNIQRES